MDSFIAMLERAKTADSFWIETAIIEFTEELVARMEHLNVSKSELAKRLGKNPSFITKLLSGQNNFTLETMARLARALDTELRVHLQPEGTVSEWITFLKGEPAVPRTLRASKTGWSCEPFEKVFKFQVLDQSNEAIPAAA